jgi:hypothetical protein
MLRICQPPKIKTADRWTGGKLDREASTRIEATLERIPMAGIVCYRI